MAQAEITRLGEWRASAVEQRAELLLGLGRPEHVVEALEEFLREHPLRERGWELLARALVAQDRQAEDEHLWPLLIDRVPAMKDELGELEAEHEQLDPLIAWVSDRSRPRRDRALALHDLQEFLRRHVDREERTAFPLMLRVLNPRAPGGGSPEGGGRLPTPRDSAGVRLDRVLPE